MLYTSIDNKKIKNLKKLSTKKYRDQANQFLVEGEHLVKEAYQTGYLKELLLKENETFTLPVETNYLSGNVLNHISTLDTPSSILGLCQKKEANILKNPHLLILDNIQDPGNMGTIIRSAVAFHFDLLISPDSVDVYSPKVIRASQGMIFHATFAIAPLEPYLKELKNRNYTILTTNVTNGTNLKIFPKPEKFAIIMGNEGQGVKEELCQYKDSDLYIGMDNKCESLNVGVAASIIMYELEK